jgi:hypothetical protein
VTEIEAKREVLSRYLALLSHPELAKIHGVRGGDDRNEELAKAVEARVRRQEPLG